MQFFKKNHQINYFLLFLLIIFIIITYFYKDESNYGFLKVYGEFGFIEILQVLTLGYCLIVTLKLKNMFLKVSNYFTFYLRSFFIFILLYEELSFLNTKFNIFNTEKNNQGHYNLHNSSVFNDQFFTLTIHPINSEFTLIYGTSIMIIGIFLLGFGSHIPLFNKIKYFFLEKKYGFFLCFYFANFILSSIIRRTINPNLLILIHEELCELLIYIVFLLDILQKKYNFKNN